MVWTLLRRTICLALINSAFRSTDKRIREGTILNPIVQCQQMSVRTIVCDRSRRLEVKPKCFRKWKFKRSWNNVSWACGIVGSFNFHPIALKEVISVSVDAISDKFILPVFIADIGRRKNKDQNESNRDQFLKPIFLKLSHIFKIYLVCSSCRGGEEI